jgi:hypothetical protein
MGFIIHKYFLSKSLKAPPPSDSKKKKKDKNHRRYSQPGGGAFAEHLTIPEHAYADSSVPTMVSRRRSSLSNTSSVPSSYRRASMPAATGYSIEEGSAEDSTSTFDEFESSAKPPYRRYSLPATATSPAATETASYWGSSQNTYASYYNIALDSKEDIPGTTNQYGYEDAAPQVRYPRRSSISSGISRTDSIGSDNSPARGRVRQENKNLKMQLDQSLKHCAMLEKRLYRTRDQLAYTHASWMDQFHEAQHRHQEEVFQAQRQAEAASNAVLEQEFDALKTAIHLMAKEEAKLVDKKKKEVKASDSRDEEAYNVKQLLAELKDWKNRHAQVTADAKRVQDLLEQENKEARDFLKESQRRVAWLEVELELAILGSQDSDRANNEQSKAISPGLVALLKSHQYELEERVDELLVENANLQEGQSESYALQGQVKELEEALTEANEQLRQHQDWHTRQVEQFKQESAKWQRKAESLQERLTHQMTSREAIRGEYVHRIEDVEAENFRLKELLDRKEDEWEHRVNLKDRTIESLRLKLSQLGEGAFDSASIQEWDKAHPLDEKDMLLRINRLTASEAKANQELLLAQEKIKELESYFVQKEGPKRNMLGDKDYRLEFADGASVDPSTLDDDASIDELLDEL